MRKLAVIIILFFPGIIYCQSWEKLITQSDQYQKLSDFRNAILYAESAKQKANTDFGEKHTNYILTLNKLASLYESTNNFKMALSLYWEVKKILNETVDPENPDYITSLNNLAECYNKTRNYNAALSLYMEASDIIKKQIGKDNTVYARLESNIAYLHQQLGDDDKALQLFEESKNIFKSTVGDKDFRYATVLNNLGLLNMKMGNYREAYSLLTEAKNIRLYTLGDKNLDYIISLNSLAGFYKSVEKYDAALPLYLQAKSILKENYGDRHPLYSILLDNLATLYALMGNYGEALPLYEEAGKLKEQKSGTNNPDYAYSLNNLAILYGSMGNVDTAIVLLEKCKKIRLETLGDKHPDYAGTLHNLGLFYCNINEFQKSKENIVPAMDIIISHYENLDILSENQKVLYKNVDLGLIYSFYSVCMQIYPHDQSIAKPMMKFYLYMQNQLLTSSKKMKEIILNSDDLELVNLFKNYRNARASIAKAVSNNSDQSLYFKTNIDSLEKVSENFERELSGKTKVFENYLNKRDYSWNNIRNNLNSNEAAVSILRFPYYNNGWTDSIKYAALIITKNIMDHPQLVELKEGAQLESKFRLHYLNSLYFDRNKSNKPVESYKVFEAFWEEIDKELNGKDIIYFSPEGVYHTVNLNTIEYPDKKFLCEKKSIIILNSLMELFEENEEVNYLNTATLFGNPNFKMYNDSKTKLGANDFNEKVLNIGNDIFSEYRGYLLKPLPGTEFEVKEINELLKGNGWKTQCFLGSQAVEDAVKSVNNPRVLHIATHGFFEQNTNANNAKQLDGFQFIGPNANTITNNPMLRSGLMLAGSQNSLNGEQNLLSKTEDGILTGYEAMNLKLDSTELVVLSACETGLGDVINGEGVYGLQRAFRYAGAKNIIMSLWKVDDNATQLLMRKFYEYWLKGNSKRAAFKLAQDYLRTETVYKAPYYWGGFVYIGMDSSDELMNPVIIVSRYKWTYLWIVLLVPVGIIIIFMRLMINLKRNSHSLK